MSNNSQFYKKIIFFLFALVPFLAYFIFNYTFFPYITGRGFAFRLIIEISLILYLIVALYNKEYLPRKSKLLFAYFVFILLLFISNVLGVNPYLSFFSSYERLEGFSTHIHLFFYFFILISLFKDEMEWKKLFAWFLVGAMPIIIFGMAQLGGQKSFPINKYISEKPWTSITQNSTTTVLTGSQFTEIVASTYSNGNSGGHRVDSKLGNSAYSAIYFLWSFFFFVLLCSRSLISNKWKSTKGWGDILGLGISTIIIVTGDLIDTFDRINITAKVELIPTFITQIFPVLTLISYVTFIYFAVKFVKKSSEGEIAPMWYVLGALASVVSIVYTQTRGAYIGLLLGVAIAILILFIKRKSITNKFTRRIITILFISVIILFITLGSVITFYKDKSFVKNNTFLNRISSINLKIANPFVMYNSIKTENYKEMLQTFGDVTLVSRGLNISMALDGVTESPKTFLIGWGQENYSQLFSKYYDPRMYAQEAWFDRTHNVFMDWMVVGGLFGLISYLSLYVVSLTLLWKRNKNLIENTIITAAITGYFVHNIFVFDNLISYIYFFFVLAYIYHLSNNKEYVFSEKFLEKINPKITILITSLVMCIVLFILVINPLSSSVDGIIANREIGQYSQGGSSNIKPVIDFYKSAINSGGLGTAEIIVNSIQNYNSVLSLSEDNKKKVTDFNKDVSDYYQFIADNIPKLEKIGKDSQSLQLIIGTFYSMTDYEKAKIYLDRALELGGSEKQLSLMQYAEIAIRHNDMETAIKFAEKAYNLETSNDNAKTFLEQVRSYKAK